MKNTLNPEKIQELRELDDEGEVLKELIDLFVPSTEKKITRLLEAKTHPDAALIKAIAHEMRSSSANVGAEHLSELAKTLEYLPLDSSYQETFSKIADEMKNEFDLVKEALFSL